MATDRAVASLIFAIGMLLASASSLARAVEAPAPPCGTMPLPSFPVIGAPANIAVWSKNTLPHSWTAPPCLGWERRSHAVLIAVAGRFNGAADPPTLLGRIAVISRRKKIRYWSHTRKNWRALYEAAHALDGPKPSASRDDFEIDELTPDRDYFFWLKENGPATGMVYKLRFHARSIDRIVVRLINITASRFMFATVLEAMQFETTIFLDRASDGDWTYYSLSRFGSAERQFSEDETASLINRLVAGYRYLANIPMHREPPAAP